jgi:hypothetical protein
MTSNNIYVYMKFIWTQLAQGLVFVHLIALSRKSSRHTCHGSSNTTTLFNDSASHEFIKLNMLVREN